MDESDFEGTVVLKQLAAIGRVEDFFDAIDSDDLGSRGGMLQPILLRNLSCAGAKPASTRMPVYFALSIRR